MSTSDNTSIRSLSEISEEETVQLSVDLVSAARRNIGFLRLVSESHWLHNSSSILEAIRRYDELWMPLIADLTVDSTPQMFLPPLDIEWVWFCHTLNPVSYRQYCESRFSKLIGKSAIFDEENEDYALNRCRTIWIPKYPSEPFENEVDPDYREKLVSKYEDLLSEIANQRHIFSKFSEPYMSEIVYLIAARQRYKGFLYMMKKYTNECSRLIPSTDILLMWLTHQSYPTAYTVEVKDFEGHMRKVVGPWEAVKEEEVEETKKLWEITFHQPYEKAGTTAIGGRVVEIKPPVYWDVTDTDVNTKYKPLIPRFLLEVCVMVKKNTTIKTMQGTLPEFLRLRMVRCHRELKIDKPISSFPSACWQKAWHFYSEFGAKGVVLELRHHGFCSFKGSTLLDTITFLWNDLLRAPSLTLGKNVDQNVWVVASITPPVQASYLLKCVPDRVTDDSGAMISDVILRMNGYRPQEGRWLSRTVLDHAGRECFVVRIRVGGGFWRRGGETPSAVKWIDRIIEIREGSWSYVAGSIGRAPVKVVGTATPKEQSEGWQAVWSFSTGDELLIRWDSSSSIADLSFDLKSQKSDSVVRLLKGRKMQYQVSQSGLESNENAKGEKEKDEEEGEDGFLTLVRLSEDNPAGKATALLNWKLLVVELLPEEDAVLVLLLCISILRSISEMRKEDVGCLLIRRRMKEAKPGTRDWGSVLLDPSLCSLSTSSPYLQPWYWNAEVVIGSDGVDHSGRQPTFTYSPAEGDVKLYRRTIIA